MATQAPLYPFDASFARNTFGSDQKQLTFGEPQSEAERFMDMHLSGHQAGNITCNDYFEYHLMFGFLCDLPIPGPVVNTSLSVTSHMDPTFLDINTTTPGSLSVSSGVQSKTSFSQFLNYPVASTLSNTNQTALCEYPLEVSPAQPRSTIMSQPSSSVSLHNTSDLGGGCTYPDTVKAKAKRRRKRKTWTAAEMEQRRIKNLVRNREAAARCREKKKQQVADQLIRSEQDGRKNACLIAERDRLLDAVKVLNATLLAHMENPLDCQAIKQGSNDDTKSPARLP